MPQHKNYVEPYCGGCSVLLAKDPEGISEVINDLDGEVTNFWDVLANPTLFPEFERVLQATPFSESVWNRAQEGGSGDVVEEAVDFFVRCRQSLAGRKQAFAPLSKTRRRRGMNEQAAAWLSAVEGLPEVHERLKRVVVYNRPAVDVIKQLDHPDTLYYLDPPYLHETRSTTSEYGDYEMPQSDHEVLLDVVLECRGKVMISGYFSDLYDSRLMRNKEQKPWTCYARAIPNNAAGGKSKKRMVECFWTNFDTPPGIGGETRSG